MKTIYVSDLLVSEPGIPVVLWGWVKNKRRHGDLVFIDVCDSTGFIQAVVSRAEIRSEQFDAVIRTTLESAVKVEGQLALNNRSVREIRVCKFEVISLATHDVHPHPRGQIDIFSTKLADHLLRNRHLYIRNPKVMATLKFRDQLMGMVRDWFRENRFMEITAPILTPLPLYDDGSALSLDVHGERVFLTQCVGFYLESAVHAFERVYNIGPSFRGEESRSKRHLMEYWHIKAEAAFGDLEDIISIVESLISYVSTRCQNECSEVFNVLGTEFCMDGTQTPFMRISYREALRVLQDSGVNHEFGKSLGSEEEALLSERFGRPFWVTGIPRKIEPFPYTIDPQDNEVTRTADLIASRGYGELLGVAEKIYEPAMFDERMHEKGKLDKPQYQWLREVHNYGCVPHIAFGMGVERLIRWLLCIPHVRDAIPFPRTFRRKIEP